MASPSQGTVEPVATVIVPTYNGGAVWHDCAQALAGSAAVIAGRACVLVVDSSSGDSTVAVAQNYGFAVRTVATPEFDHGGTRNMAATLGDRHSDVVVFLTQDAILASADALDLLLQAFVDSDVAVAYGRQLPHHDANPIASHARQFNYGAHSHVRGRRDVSTAGLKTVFASNSFAAYRLSVFNDLGGFPEKNILSEDMYFTAKAVMAGYKVAYVAGAAVRHSHNYTPLEEFRRYFDIGVFHRNEAWIAREFGGAGGEGKRFIVSELRSLARNSPSWIPRACLHNALKILGYKLGKNHGMLPLAWKRRLSMHRRYWDR